jgi:LuxR family maltose regulon positive regulatory protein
VAALNKVQAGVGEDALAVLRSTQPPPIESVLTVLINEVAAAMVDEFALVLDDYHLIEAKPVHDAVAFLLEHMPPQMHLIIASRGDPPLPLARLLALVAISQSSMLSTCASPPRRRSPSSATRWAWIFRSRILGR